jgi:hypothetical protein
VEKCGKDRQATDDNTIPCMHFACWITRATVTHSEYLINTYCFSMATVVTRMHLSVLLYYIACLIFLGIFRYPVIYATIGQKVK